jgi:hypothetical protein
MDAGTVEYLPTAKAAQWMAKLGFRVSPATLRQWRWKGQGPRFVKLTGGGECFYALSDLEAYIAGRVYQNTGEVTAATAAAR